MAVGVGSNLVRLRSLASSYAAALCEEFSVPVGQRGHRHTSVRPPVAEFTQRQCD